MTDRLPGRLRARAAADRLEVPVPKCKCSHSRLQHGRQAGQCYATVCGCTAYRPDVKS